MPVAMLGKKTELLGLAGALGLGASIAGEGEAEATPIAQWKRIIRAMKGAVVHDSGLDNAHSQSARWGVVELPDHRTIRVDPKRGIDEVTKTSTGWRKINRIADVADTRKMVNPTKVTEQAISRTERNYIRSHPIVRAEGLLQSMAESAPSEYDRILSRSLAGATASRMIDKGKLILEGEHWYTASTKKALKRLEGERGDSYIEKAIDEATGVMGDRLGVSRRCGVDPHCWIEDIYSRVNELAKLNQRAGYVNRELRGSIYARINEHLKPRFDSGDLIRDPTDPSRLFLGGPAQARIKAKEAETQLANYLELPQATQPERDNLLRLEGLAKSLGGLSGRDIKKYQPSFAQREPGLMSQLFKGGGEKLPSERFAEAAQAIPGTGKYRYSVVESPPTYGAGEYTASSGNRRMYRIAIHPQEKLDIEKEFPGIFSMAHSEPYTSAKVPTMGWFKVIDDIANNTWYIEEIQTDILAKARNTFGQDATMIPKVLDLEKKYGDWADYGLASVLKDAREIGVGTVKIISSEAVQTLWSGRLGQGKAVKYYRDLPKRFGFNMDIQYEPEVGRVRTHLPDPFKVSNRIPSIVFTAGAAAGGGMGILDLLEPSEAEAMPRGVYNKISPKALAGEISSALKVLKGETLDGKVIKDVRKGEGNWRAILFDDDTMMTVTNTELNDLSRAVGSKRYLSKFKDQEGPSMTEQAMKSLQYHQARIKPFITQGTQEVYHKQYLRRLQEMGEDTVGSSMVQFGSKSFIMPTDYAKHLQDLGILKIKKDY